MTDHTGARLAAAAAGLATRSIRIGEHDGRPVTVLTATRSYRADAEDLWNALTDPERLPRWFLPVSGDLTVGGRYQFEGNAGGVVESCDPPREARLTWEYGSEVSWLRLLVEPSGPTTTLTLEHSAAIDDDRWREYGPGAVGVGWDLALNGLTAHLADGAALDPAEAMAWSMSEEGIAVMTESADGWTRASIDAGTDPDEARAAGARTLAFYTGRPVAQA